MLSSISWPTFLTAISILLLAYYLVILSLYFRTELFSLFASADRALSYIAMTAASDQENPHLPGKVHELLEDLKNLLATAVQAKTVREELFLAIQLLLRSYAMLKDLQITTEINDHIRSSLKDTCSITLSDAEMNRLWNG